MLCQFLFALILFSVYSCFRFIASSLKGYAKRLELAQEGAKIKAEKEKGIDALRKERDELSPKKDEAEAKKKEAEEKETEAKDRHRKAWEGWSSHIYHILPYRYVS